MRPQFSLRFLFALLTLCAVAFGFALVVGDGLAQASEPPWAFRLISLSSVCAGLAAMFMAAVQRNSPT
jgi:hypothetical protein